MSFVAFIPDPGLTSSSSSFRIFNGCLTFYVVAKDSDGERLFLADYH